MESSLDAQVALVHLYSLTSMRHVSKDPEPELGNIFSLEGIEGWTGTFTLLYLAIF